jgi:outer membrane receptor protein involved in Fe transport
MGRPWRTDKFLPSTTALRLLSVSTTEAGVLVEAEGQSSAQRPSCGRRSHARHGRYWRTLKDLALQGQSLTQYATPYSVTTNLDNDLGVYIQDRWTKDRLMLTLGVRYDFTNTSAPDQALG